MGFVNESVPKEHWDNRTLQARASNGSGFLVDYRIRPFGATEAQGVYSFIDDSILRPEILWIEVKEGNTPEEKTEYAQHPTVHWAWNGDMNTISGFSVYVNGTPVSWIPTSGPITQWSPITGQKSMDVRLPTVCGRSYMFEVAANAGEGRSRLSNAVPYHQPPCKRYAQVTYEGFLFGWLLGETASDCRDARLRVNLGEDPLHKGPGDDWENFYDLPQVECNTYYDFSSYPNRVQYVGIGPLSSDPNAKTGIDITAGFAKHNPFGTKSAKYDLICSSFKQIPIQPMTDEEWVKFEIFEEVRCPNWGPSDWWYGSGTIYVNIKGVIGTE
jgi:hypothetical protein